MSRLVDPARVYRNIIEHRTRNRRYARLCVALVTVALLLIGIAVWLIK